MYRRQTVITWTDFLFSPSPLPVQTILTETLTRFYAPAVSLWVNIVLFHNERWSLRFSAFPWKTLVLFSHITKAFLKRAIHASFKNKMWVQPSAELWSWQGHLWPRVWGIPCAWLPHLHRNLLPGESHSKESLEKGCSVCASPLTPVEQKAVSVGIPDRDQDVLAAKASSDPARERPSLHKGRCHTLGVIAALLLRRHEVPVFLKLGCKSLTYFHVNYYYY